MSINSLDSDVLTYLLGFLPPKEWFKIETVNKRWQRCVRKLINRRITEFKSSQYNDESIFSNAFYRKYNSYGEADENGSYFMYIIDDINIAVVLNILSKCQNVKYLNLSRTHFISNSNILIQIAKLTPKLERINFKYSTFELAHGEWDQFTQFIGPKLINCNFIRIDTEFNLILSRKLFSNFKNIEKLKFETFTNEMPQELFEHLISCEKLTSLKWNNRYNSDYLNEKQNLIQVFQRLIYLNTNLHVFTKLNCKMDLLTELIIHANNWCHYNQMDSIEYPNLIKLSLNYLFSGYLMVFSKVKFPKLQFLSIEFVNKYFEDEHFEEKIIFYQLFENVNEINFKNYYFTEKIYQFPNLTKLTFNCSYIDIIKQLEICLNHKSLDQIVIDKIKFSNYKKIDLLINIFDKIISLEVERENLNVKILISFKITKFNNEEYETRLNVVNDYKMKFQYNNWNVLLNDDCDYMMLYLKK